MSKPLAEVHDGRRLSVPLQALLFSFADVLKDRNLLVDENIVEEIKKRQLSILC